MAHPTPIAINELKSELDEATGQWRAGKRVRVRRLGGGNWVFSVPVSRLRTFDFSFEAPGSICLAKQKISTIGKEVSFVSASLEKDHLRLVVAEVKRVLETAADEESAADAALFEAHQVLQRLSDPLRKVATARAIRGISEVFRNAAAHAVQDAASQSSDLGVLVRALEEPAAMEKLIGEDPLAPARLRGVRARERLLSAEGGTLTVDEVANHLNLTRQAVNRRRQQGSLLALDAGRHGYLYPAWQFARRGTVEHLSEALSALRHFDPWTQHGFMVGESVRLGGRRPIDVLRAGEVPSVVAAAAAYAEHGAA